MNTSCRIIFTSLIVLATLKGQAQSDCQRLLDEAAQYENTQQYDRALKKYLSAKEECDAKISAQVNTLILKVFDKIQRQKHDADEAKKSAENAARAARAAETKAKAAQAKAERSAKSNQLVALSLTKQNQDPTLSMQLAAMAWELGVDSATGMCTEAGASAVLRDISSDPANWFYLPFKGHRGRVLRVAFSPDDSQVVTGGEDGTVRFWDLKGHAVDTLWGHRGQITALQFSPDKKWLLTAALDSTVRIWTADGKPLHVLKHNGIVESIRMPRQSKQLLTTCMDTVWTWDVETGIRQRGWAMREAGAAEVVFSTTDSLMLTVRDGRVKLWTQNGRFIDSLFRGKHVLSVRFDPMGKYIVGASNTTLYRISRQAFHRIDSLVCDMDPSFFDLSANGDWVFWGGGYTHVWYCNLEELKAPRYFSSEGGMAISRGNPGSGIHFLGGDNLCLWRGYSQEPVVLRSSSSSGSGSGGVNDAAFSEDGRWLLTGDDSGIARLWFASSDWPNRQPSWMRTQFVGKEILPDQRHLLIKNQQHPVLFNLFTQEMVSLPISDVRQIVPSPDGALFVINTYTDSLLYFFDSTGTLLFQHVLPGGSLPIRRAAVDMGFSPDQRYLLLVDQENKIAVMRLEDGTCFPVAHTFHNEIFFTWAPDSRHFATYVSSDSIAYLWTAQGQLAASLRGCRSPLLEIRFLHGQRILGRSRGGNILWNMSGQKMGRFSDVSIDVSPDKRRILAYNPQGGYWVYDTDAKPLYMLERSNQIDRLNNFQFSFDGRYIVHMLTKESYFWSSEGKYLFKVEGEVFNTAQRRDGFFFPNGDVLALSNSQGVYTLRRWNAEGKLVKIYEGLDERPNTYEVSPDGHYIVAFSGYQKATVWDANGSLFSVYRSPRSFYNVFFLPGSQHLYIETSRGLPQAWPLGAAFARRCQVLDRTDLIRAGAGGDVEEVLRTANAADLEEIGDYYYDRADWPTARRFYTRLLEMYTSPEALRALYHIGEQIGEPYPLPPFYACQNMSDLIGHANFFYNKKQWKTAYDLYDKAELMGQSSRCLNQMCEMSDTLHMDFDRNRYLHLEGNFLELYSAAGYLWNSRKDVPMARRLFENALNIQYDSYLLQQLYDLCESEHIPFDTLRFLATENFYNLFQSGGFFFEKQKWSMARLLYQKADALYRNPDVRLRLLAIADTLHQTYDFNQMLEFTDPSEINQISNALEETEQWERLTKLYQHSEALQHRPENVVYLHQLARRMHQPFDYNLMLQSENPEELNVYASTLNETNDGPTRDRVPLLEKAIQMEEKRLRLDSTLSKYTLTSYYNNYGFCLLFLPAPKQAEIALRKAITLQSDLPVIYTNLPIALLMQPGRYEEAKALYLEYANKPYRSGTYRQVFLSDLKDLQNQGISHPDFEKIEELMKEKK